MVDHRSTGLPECGPTESSAPEPCSIYSHLNSCQYFLNIFFDAADCTLSHVFSISHIFGSCIQYFTYLCHMYL